LAKRVESPGNRIKAQQMAELSVVRRYARALFGSATQAGSVDEVEEDLKGIDHILKVAPALPRALGAPTIAASRKQELIGQAFEGRISPLTLRFLRLVLHRRREAILPDVYPEFQRLANEARNILPVEVQSAAPLTDQEQSALSDALAGRTGKTIRLEVSVAPELLGGMIVRMGDTVLDGSVRNKLEQLHTRLLTGKA
jgi:F-type H+-transporting ATPase subunit delta